MSAPTIFMDTPASALPNYESFKAHLIRFTESGASCWVANPTPQQIRQLEAALLSHFRDPKVVVEVGFDPTFHFRFSIVPKPQKRTVTVCMAPLTPLALDVCLALNIRIDESVQQRIRKAYNESLARSIESLSPGPDQTVLPK